MSTPPAPFKPFSESEFAAIESAMLETPRGRTFLAEYARRNRQADTALILAAIDRLQGALVGAQMAQSVDRLEPDLVDLAERHDAAAPPQAHDTLASPVAPELPAPAAPKVEMPTPSKPSPAQAEPLSVESPVPPPPVRVQLPSPPQEQPTAAATAAEPPRPGGEIAVPAVPRPAADAATASAPAMTAPPPRASPRPGDEIALPAAPQPAADAASAPVAATAPPPASPPPMTWVPPVASAPPEPPKPASDSFGAITALSTEEKIALFT